MSEFQTRFDRQTRFAPLGARGQALLAERRVLLVGCGALGGALAQSLVRSGVGLVRIVDRDVVEESNLPRQVLFDAVHARESRPKAQAAAESLARVGGPTRVEAHAAHVDADNLGELGRDVDLVLDGTDNLETRYLINDWCVERGTPWVYGGVVGSGGLVLAVVPQVGPCLACVFPELPPPGTLETCDTAGVLQPAVALVAAMQAGLALRLLAGLTPPKSALIELDAWDGRARTLELARDPTCRVCVAREFRFLHQAGGPRATSLCGRNSVQVRAASTRPDLERLAARLEGRVHGLLRAGPLLRFTSGAERFTVFPDGRALIEGTSDTARALVLYERFLGS